MTVSVLWLFFMVLWVGLHCVIVVFPDHTHLLLTLVVFVNQKFNLVVNNHKKEKLNEYYQIFFLLTKVNWQKI